ncbi:hypothetical protein EJ02DRAFT_430682 [Clathrospora elynae]|uniref:Ribosome assembly protein 3 n=1 Tax=Clathrospora elynae TaxID=706981 RepID=A0A6A5T2D6_9PLEO|nr:hypothetical protein EJ02DRAFT_430682 [Clathrospora elynae]
MAAQKTAYGGEKKRKSKKRRTRTDVSSSSESDSDVSTKKSRKAAVVEELVKDASPVAEEAAPAPKSIKEKKNKSKSTAVPEPETNGDTAMEDAPTSPSPAPVAPKVKSTPAKQPQDDFSAIYLRKIAGEFADDLDKVREAQDFKASSVPMLIHALKQGESLFSVEEKRRVIGAAST